MKNNLFLAVCLCSGCFCMAQTNAILDDYSIDTNVKDASQMVSKYHQQITILNRNGEHFADMVFGLRKGAKLSSFSGVIQDNSGKVIRKIKMSDLDKTEYTTNFADDGLTYSFDCTSPTIPFTVTYDYEIKEGNGFVALPEFRPQYSPNLEIKKSSYHLTIPKELQCRYKLENIDCDVVKSETNDNKETFSIQWNDIKAINSEQFMPAKEKFIPCVYFSTQSFEYFDHPGTLTTWKDFGEWNYLLSKERKQLPDELRQKLHEMTDTCTSEYSKLKLIYNYLAQTTRYVSIQLGIGGFQPMSAAEVYRTGYGDCKALANYMHSMLNEIGLESYYTIISMTRKELPTDFAAFDFFNHAIIKVIVDKKTMWIDCTAPELPLGFIHENIAGHDAVVIAQGNSHIERLPMYSETDNLQESNVKITLDEKGGANVLFCQRSYANQFENRFALSEESEKNKARCINASLNIPKAENLKVSITEDKDTNSKGCIEIKAEENTIKYCQTSAQRMFLPVTPLHQHYSNIANNIRTMDIYIQSGYNDIDTVTYILPSDYRIESMAKPIDYECCFGKLSSNITVQDNVITIVQNLTIKNGVFPKDKFAELKDFYQKIVTMYTGKIIVIKAHGVS